MSYSYLLEQLKLKKNSSDNTKYWQGYKYIGSHTRLMRVQNEVQPLWRIGRILKVNHTFTIYSVILLLGFYLENLKLMFTHLYTNVYSCFGHSYQNLEECPSVGKWKNKLWFNCTWNTTQQLKEMKY